MTDANKSDNDDIWSRWLLRGRNGGDAEAARSIKELTEVYADRILDGAEIDGGMTLLDIGTGDGLIAFQAISRVGSTLQVIFTDISEPMLRYVDKLSRSLNVSDQCTFLLNSADNLKDVADESVDAVVVRAVLTYVDDKLAALTEFFRVLKPGGRLSLCEPILRDEAIIVCQLKSYLANLPHAKENRLLRLQCRIRAMQYPDSIAKIQQDSITNFTERDLFLFADKAGFEHVHMEFHMNKNLGSITVWDVFLESSPHPRAPTIRQILDVEFDSEDREYFIKEFRPMIEGRQPNGLNRVAFLTAKKPYP